MTKGIFIPDITVEMIRKASLEAIETLLVEGEMYDVDMPKWIPCSERLPEEPYGCLVTVWDTDLITMDEFDNLLPYFVGWDGKQWNDADGEQCPFEVIAWMPLPEPYGGDSNA